MEKPTVAIAGATGFVGRALLQALDPQQPVIALTRGVGRQEQPQRLWRTCNLFNLLHTERALQGAHTAFYLVHSMSPQAALTQGHFADMDLICADNFGRAARRAGVQHIVYLGGIMPTDGTLSAHLRSRLEVEQALGDAGVPVTALRAGLVVGPGGSSFRMMTRLVRRLPFMLTPSWTRSHTQPVALDDVVAMLVYSMLHPETAGEHYDLGCPDVLTYQAMMQHTAAALGRRVRMVTVPVESLNLSLWWVSLITQTPRQLVLPLVQSLRHDMVATDGLRLQHQAQRPAMSFDDALRTALEQEKASRAQSAWVGENARRARAQQGTSRFVPKPARDLAPMQTRHRTVVSVQRMPMPPHTNAEWVAQEYARWLPSFMWPWLRVEIKDGRYYRFSFLGKVLLELRHAPERSDATRQLFYIHGGLLARSPQQPEPGRFEFRVVLGGRYIITAVHDFVPRLPWYLYKATQALAHRVVMHFFARHLRGIDSRQTAPQGKELHA